MSMYEGGPTKLDIFTLLDSTVQYFMFIIKFII